MTETAPTLQLKHIYAANAGPATPLSKCAGYFHRTDWTVIGRTGEALTPVLIFDQFEEIFTIGLASERSRGAAQRFLGELAELIENRPPDSIAEALEGDVDVLEAYDFDRQDYRIVVALREDYLAQLDNLRQRAPLLGRNYLRLRRMTGRQCLDAMTRPIPGLIASEVAQEILHFVGRVSPEDAFGGNASSAARRGAA